MTSVLLVLLLTAAAPAQEPKTSAQEILQLLPLLQQNQQRELERAARQLVELRQRRYEREVTLSINNAWWTNNGLVERLGLSDDQKLRIERAYENHRLKLASSAELLEKEEAQLSMLLNAEPINRNAILTQIDRVVQARGEMERSNSAMTLEMREVLTRAQWTQLQSQPQWSTGAGVYLRTQPGGFGPGERSGGGRGGAPGTTATPGTTPGARSGGRGQRSPQPQQQPK